MSFFQAKKFGFLLAASAVLTLVAAQGCGNDDDSQAAPSGAGKANGGSGGKSTAGAGGKSSAGAGATDSAAGSTPVDEGGAGGAAPVDNNTDTAGAGGEAGAISCDDPSGCYACTPTTTLQFANHCVEGGCPATFDNSKLTKLNLVGTL